MIFEARTRQFAVDVDIASAKLERTIDQIQSFSRERRRQKRAVIIRAVSLDASRDNDFRERLVRQLEMRIRFVILKEHIESRLVLLDKIRFEDQSLDLAVDNDELKIGYESYELTCLGVVVAARLEVRSDAVPEVFRLADVDYLSRGILMNVDARVCR